MSSKPFGIDVSRWQGRINWDAIALHEPQVQFVGIRVGMSWGYIDPEFQRNWLGAKKYNIARTAYHVLYPGQGAQRQMDNMFSALPPDDMGELPISLDLEMDLGQSPSAITKEINESANIIEQRTGRKPIIYTRASWMDAHTLQGSWRSEYDYWLAHYGYQNAPRLLPPSMPTGVLQERCIIHQYTSIGEPFGVASKSLDYNRWQYDLDHLNSYIVKDAEEPQATALQHIEAIRAQCDELERLV